MGRRRRAAAGMRSNQHAMPRLGLYSVNGGNITQYSWRLRCLF